MACDRRSARDLRAAAPLRRFSAQLTVLVPPLTALMLEPWLRFSDFGARNRNRGGALFRASRHLPVFRYGEPRSAQARKVRASTNACAYSPFRRIKQNSGIGEYTPASGLWAMGSRAVSCAMPADPDTRAGHGPTHCPQAGRVFIRTHLCDSNGSCALLSSDLTYDLVRRNQSIID